MSFFTIEKNNNLKTQTPKEKEIRTYSSIEEIIKDIELIKLSQKEMGKDIIIDMIYKLLILHSSYLSQNPSNNIWEAIYNITSQLKEEFPEEEIFKKSHKNRKDMYIGNFLYSGDTETMLNLFQEKTTFTMEYELSNNCKSETIEENAIYEMEQSAKRYLQDKKIYTIQQ